MLSPAQGPCTHSLRCNKGSSTTMEVTLSPAASASHTPHNLTMSPACGRGAQEVMGCAYSLLSVCIH